MTVCCVYCVRNDPLAALPVAKDLAKRGVLVIPRRSAVEVAG